MKKKVKKPWKYKKNVKEQIKAFDIYLYWVITFSKNDLYYFKYCSRFLKFFFLLTNFQN